MVPAAVSLDLSLETLRRIVGDFVGGLERGLARDGQMLKCIPTFVTDLPTGRERGEYLVVDLGGTNLRVGRAVLHGDSTFELGRKKWPLSEEVKSGSGRDLFNFIATSVHAYLAECSGDLLNRALQHDCVPIGFTFSYPVRQASLASGTLIEWSKAIVCADVVGRDVVQLLHEAFHRIGLQFQVRALLNDTVGTLAAHAYADPDTAISVILGTGTNAAYVEQTKHIHKLKVSDSHPTSAGASATSKDRMVINVEWGAFGDGHPEYLPLTAEDRLIDAQSKNPGRQLFEKMVSGMYLGEIARLTLLGLFPSLQDTAPFALETADLSAIDGDVDPANVRAIFRKRLAWADLTDAQLAQAIRVCQLVCTRSARLCASAIAALYRKIGSPGTRLVVAIDGALYENHPNYQHRLTETLDQLIPGNSIVLKLAKDESIVGAATVIAAHVL